MSINIPVNDNLQPVALSSIAKMEVTASWGGFGPRIVKIEDANQNVQFLKFDDLIKKLGEEISQVRTTTNLTSQTKGTLENLGLTLLKVKDLDQGTRRWTHELFHASIFSDRSNKISASLNEQKTISKIIDCCEKLLPYINQMYKKIGYVEECSFTHIFLKEKKDSVLLTHLFDKKFNSEEMLGVYDLLNVHEWSTKN